MRQYKAREAKETKDTGWTTGTGYKDILSYKVWLTLSKVSLVKDQHKSRTLDIKHINNIKELYEFVDLCKEEALDRISFDHDIYDNDIDEASLVAFRVFYVNKTESELWREYEMYVSCVNNDNIVTYKEYSLNKTFEEKELAEYERLKLKFERKSK